MEVEGTPGLGVMRGADFALVLAGPSGDPVGTSGEGRDDGEG
jgi:hypothetical protein